MADFNILMEIGISC